MNSYRTNLSGLSLAIAVTLLMCQRPPVVQAAVLPPDATVGGLSQADWSDEWWRLAMGFPGNQVFGPSAVPQLGDRGPVFFLWGTAGGRTQTRSATIRPDQHIFFNLVGTLFFYSPDEEKNEQEDRQALADEISRGAGLFLRIDGETPAVNLTDHAQVTEQPGYFDLTLAETNIFAGTPGPNFGLSGAFSVMLEPLSPGEHVIEFGGGVDNPDGSVGFRNSVLYNVTVVPEPTTMGLLVAGGLLVVLAVGRRRANSSQA